MRLERESGVRSSQAWQPTPVFLLGESPWTEEPGEPQSMGSQRIGHDWATKQSTAQKDLGLHPESSVIFVLIINVKSTPKFRGLSQVPFSYWQFRWLRIWARITRGSGTPLCVMSVGMTPRGLKDPRWLHACVWDLAGGFWLCASVLFHRAKIGDCKAL